MPIIDFHNHYYPPAYLDALRSGSSAVEVTIDSDGNPRIFYPGDYNICVPGHRDIDYREQVLIEHGVDTQVITLTTPGTHVEAPATAVRFAALVNDAFARRRGHDRLLANAVGRLPHGHHARRREDRVYGDSGALPAHSLGAHSHGRRDSLPGRAPGPRLRSLQRMPGQHFAPTQRDP